MIIHGLPVDQDKFHRELLLKYRQLSDQMNRKNSNTSVKVPKRVDVLIRFLREGINQLLSNLGNVNELLRKLQHLENHFDNSKSNQKGADKIRRSLNMILLGQAGLADGNMHLDQLLLSLKALINDFKIDENAPNNLRDDIDLHWKQIFTSYRHDNYADLVESYNKLLNKSRLQKLNIDPVLLGTTKQLDVSFTPEQKERLAQPKKSAAKRASLQLLESPPSSPSPPPAPSMKLKNKASAAKSGCSHNKSSEQQQEPRIHTVAGRIKATNQKWQSKCNTLLTEIVANKQNITPTERQSNGGPLKKDLVQDSHAPSMFWSRESLKYLSECIRLAVGNHELLSKLQRIQSKCKSGSLSYNDYRAVINLHSIMLGK